MFKVASRMSKTVLTAAAVISLMLTSAMAGPEGTYTVQGNSPGSGDPYEGTVTVERTGETYQIVWEIGGTTFVGSGLGAAPAKGGTIMGPADDADYVLTVGYVSLPNNFGLAYYVEQADGTWKGIWTYGGSDEIGSEIWTRN